METIRDAGMSAAPRRFLASLLAPRTWKLMIVGAYPYLLVCSNLFEVLERTGPAGAFFADTLLPASLIGYVVLIFVLKKRDL